MMQHEEDMHTDLLFDGPAEVEPPRSIKINYKLFVKIGFLVFAAGAAGVPYVSAAMKAGKSNYALGVTFAACTLLANGGEGAWVWLNQLNQFKLNFFPKNKSRLYIVSVNVILNILSIVSCIPFVYKIYLYNNSIVYPILDTFSSFGYKVLGYYRTYYWVINRNNPSNQLAEGTVHAIDRRIIPYVASHTDNDAVVEIINRLCGSKLSLDRLIDLIVSFNARQSLATDFPKVYFSRTEKYIVAIISAIFPIIFSFVNFLFGYDGLKTGVYDNVPFDVIFTILSTFPSLIVDLIVTAITFFNIYEIGKNKICYHNNMDYMGRFYLGGPFVRYLFLLLVVGVCATSTNSNIYITEDFLSKKGIGEDVSVFIAAVYAIANIIFSSYTLTYVFDEIGINVAKSVCKSPFNVAKAISELSIFSNTLKTDPDAQALLTEKNVDGAVSSLCTYSSAPTRAVNN